MVRQYPKPRDDHQNLREIARTNAGAMIAETTGTETLEDEGVVVDLEITIGGGRGNEISTEVIGIMTMIGENETDGARLAQRQDEIGMADEMIDESGIRDMMRTIIGIGAEVPAKIDLEADRETNTVDRNPVF